MTDIKETLVYYLNRQRDSVLWKVDGVPERELRMPMTATGTNLLGLVKHLASVEAGYFGECLGRPWPEPMPWLSEDAEDNADMWATADESPALVLDLYRRVIAHADETIAALPLDAPGHVPWWDPQETTLHRLLVHMTAETARHAGHLDILRETIDGNRGTQRTIRNLPEHDDAWWTAYVARLRQVAEESGS
jgi:uncharacterized damage-inducible protein DinB